MKNFSSDHFAFDESALAQKGGAFITIDVQKKFCHVARFRGGWLVPDQLDINHSVYMIGKMLKQARLNDIPVIHVRSAEPAADEYDFYRLKSQLSDIQVQKQSRSGFDDGAQTSVLNAVLRAKDIDRVVLSGFWLEQCVQATALSALNRGFRAAVVRDGCSPLDYSRRRNTLGQMKEMGVDIIRAHDVADYIKI